MVPRKVVQKEDPILCKVLRWLDDRRKPPWKDVRLEGAAIRSYWSMFEQIEFINGILYCRSPPQLIAPEAIRNQIFEFQHTERTNGHLDIKRTSSSAKQRFWWPGMKQDVAQWCKHCDTCQQHNPNGMLSI